MIRIVNIAKTYDRGESAVRALAGISLEITEGEFVAIMGPSGSGKSTLLHVLGLLDVPDSGSYQLFGRDVHALSDDQLAEMRNTFIGFVFQHFNLLSRVPALENVILPQLYTRRQPNPEHGRSMLEKVGLGDRIAHRPNELSGGQQQRVAIARALINNPRLILADEPTGNLDSASAVEIMGIISGLNRAGLTIVMVTHEEDIARHARRIIHMRDGLIQKDESNVAADIVPSRKFENQKSPPQADQPAAEKIANSAHAGWEALVAGLQANLKQAWRALAARKVRSALSMLGILIGVAAVIAMLAIGQGAKKSINDQLSNLGSNLLTLRAAPPHLQGIAMSEGMMLRFTREDIVEIKREINSISNIAGIVQGRGQATYGGQNWNTQVLGVEPVYAQMHSSQPVIGRFFTAEEESSKARVAAVGLTVVRKLFGDVSPLGEFIKINKVNFQIIGVLPEKGADKMRDQDDLVLIPLATAMDRLQGKKCFDQIEVEMASLDDMEDAQNNIRSLIIRTHRLPPSRYDSFQIHNLAEMKEAISSSSRTMSWLLSAIAAVSLLVGGIGIMNIMLVSVTERTREIGVRKAIGARGRDIMVQFLVEALVVSLVGGFAGILFGWLISFCVSTFAGWASLITMSSIILSVSFSGTIGIIFGLWPARQAARLNPIEALRYE